MEKGFHCISETPAQDGKYLVKFVHPELPDWDNTETVRRTFQNGEWIKPYYHRLNDGYQMTGWYDTTLKE